MAMLRRFIGAISIVAKTGAVCRGFPKTTLSKPYLLLPNPCRDDAIAHAPAFGPALNQMQR
jgi:hypothetical protein